MSAEKSKPLVTDAAHCDNVDDSPAQAAQSADQSRANPKKPKEINGPAGLEPTRYGDWEAKGRCYDF